MLATKAQYSLKAGLKVPLEAYVATYQGSHAPGPLHVAKPVLATAQGSPGCFTDHSHPACTYQGPLGSPLAGNGRPWRVPLSCSDVHSSASAGCSRRLVVVPRDPHDG